MYYKLLTSWLTTIDNYVINYCESAYERHVKIFFGPIKNSAEVLNKFKYKGFLASSVSIYDFSTLCTTLPHNLIKEKLTELIEQTEQRPAHFIWLVMKNLISLPNNLKDIIYGHVKQFVTPSITFWTVYSLYLAPNCIDKL